MFLNLLPAVEFGHHGPQRKKSLKLQHQGTHLYFSMSEGSERRAAVQLDVGRSRRVEAMVARAFLAANDGIARTAARDILMRVTAPMAGAHCSAKNPEPSACAGRPPCSTDCRRKGFVTLIFRPGVSGLG